MKLRMICVALLLATLTGCVLAPFIDSVKKAGVTPSDREQLLYVDIQKFHELRFWGNRQELVEYLLPDRRQELQMDLAKADKDQKIVDSKQESVDFSEESRVAKVEMLVRAYRVPFYVVIDRVEQQRWQFTFADGWKLAAREETKKGS